MKILLDWIKDYPDAIPSCMGIIKKKKKKKKLVYKATHDWFKFDRARESVLF